MHTAWISCAHHMAITCTPHGHHMDFSCGTLAANLICLPDPTRLIVGIIFSCTPHGYHMHTTWISHAHHMAVTCTLHGYHIHLISPVRRWILNSSSFHCHQPDCWNYLHALHMGITYTPQAHHMGITYTPHGCHMYTAWISHTFYLTCETLVAILNSSSSHCHQPDCWNYLHALHLLQSY